MDIKNPANMLSRGSQNELYSNGTATITHAAQVDPQQFRSSETASVVYHGAEDYSFPKTGNPAGVEVYAEALKTAEEEEQHSKVLYLLSSGLQDTSAGLLRAYEAAMSKLPTDLQEKDWAFSVANGSLVFTEGSNPLSEQEWVMLNDAFSSTNVEYHANRVASTVIRAFEIERGSDGVSTWFGRFDVSNENFADIVDLRAYLLSHGPEGKYGWWRQPNTPSSHDSLYSTGDYAMMDQIYVRAEPRFAKK